MGKKKKLSDTPHIALELSASCFHGRSLPQPARESHDSAETGYSHPHLREGNEVDLG